MKKSFMFLPVAGLLVALTTAIASANENILLEENGFLAFEAETIAPVGDCRLYTSPSPRDRG